MIGPVRLRRLWDTHPYLWDAALAVVVAGPILGMVVSGKTIRGGHPLTDVDGIAAVLAMVLVSQRRRARFVVLALSVAALVVIAIVFADLAVALVLATMVAMYTVAVAVRRRTTVVTPLATAASLYLVTIVWVSQSATTPGAALVAWTGMCAAVGGAVRAQREYVAAVEERAVRAEATRDEEARRRVAEERLRIARELHDVIAHHIALINIQAGAASHLLRSRPDQAETALGHIRDAGSAVIDELGSLLYVLRTAGDEPVPTEPVPGLDGLGQLLESFSAAGLRVTHRVTGEHRPLPAAVDLAAYRIIQEGLTNAHKHGEGERATLTVAYRPGALDIAIRNRAGTAAAGTGHGLTGMRERAHAVGGSLSAKVAPDGEFRLDAHLPVRDDVETARMPA